MQKSEVILVWRPARVCQLHVLMSPSPSCLMTSVFAQETENVRAEAETWVFSLPDVYKRANLHRKLPSSLFSLVTILRESSVFVVLVYFFHLFIFFLNVGTFFYLFFIFFRNSIVIFVKHNVCRGLFAICRMSGVNLKFSLKLGPLYVSQFPKFVCSYEHLCAADSWEEEYCPEMLIRRLTIFK